MGLSVDFPLACFVTYNIHSFDTDGHKSELVLVRKINHRLS